VDLAFANANCRKVASKGPLDVLCERSRGTRGARPRALEVTTGAPRDRAELPEVFGDAGGLCIVLQVHVGPFSPEAEQQLVHRAKAGDRVALGRLLEAFGPTLFRSVLYPRLGDVTAAEQALGDTYARVVEKIALFEWQAPGIYPWLRRIALHVAIDALRARRREVLFEPSDLQRAAEASPTGEAGESPAELWMAERDLEAARAKVARGLAKINPRYATAIRLRVIEEWAREEVAVALGVSTATFDVVLHRAMTALRKAIAEDVPEAEER
jgi:RNA polymerase sigma factor (sigma-70 family)